MERSRRGRCGRLLLLGALLLAAGGAGGCASWTNPTLWDAIPVNRLPKEVFGLPREEQRTIPLTLLRQNPPDKYLLDAGDLLAVYIEGVLGQREQPPPVVQFAQEPGAGAPPPAVGYPIPVQEDGTLVLPLIPPIEVKGMSVIKVQERVRQTYIDRGILKEGAVRVLVSLVKPRTYHVTVIRQDSGGVVFSAGGTLAPSRRGTGVPLDLPAYQNDLLNALSRSGGLPGLDASSTVVIQRGSSLDPATGLPRDIPPGTPVSAVSATQQQIRVPLRMRPNEPLPFRPEDVILRTGDIVFIETRDTEVYYTGGLLPVAELILPRDYDLDVLEAVTQSRGPLFNGGVNFNNLNGSILNNGVGNPSPTLLTVIRKTPNCGQITIRVDLSEAAQDPRKRILVQPGDFLILQESMAQSFTRYVLQTFRFQFTSVLLRQRDAVLTEVSNFP